MSFVRSHDVEIHYESQGEGPAILFAHGGFGRSRSPYFEEPEAFNAVLERFF